MPRAFLSSPFWSDPQNEVARRRTASLALAIAIHVLLLLLLLRLAPPPFASVAPAPKGITLDLLPEAEADADQTETKAAEKQESRQTPPERPQVLPKPEVEVPSTQSTPQSDIWSKVVPLTQRDMAAVDTAISRPAEKSAARSGERSASSAVVGTGPNGQPLYAAQWYREPTDALLDLYLPPNAPGTGYGRIACRTIADYRVDNCEEVDEFPPGSGLAGAVRLAARQFRVIPPRVGGRTMVGAWVAIQIDYWEGEIR